MKKLILGSLLLCSSFISQAGIIVGEMTGADLAGSLVTAYFGDGTSQTKVWKKSTTMPEAGGVKNPGWAIDLKGQTFGDFDNINNMYVGEFRLKNLGMDSGIVGLSIELTSAYFDTIFSFDGPKTPGSGTGRTFAASDDNVKASFSNPYSMDYNDLYSTMSLSWMSGTALTKGSELIFLTDTDMEIPEPSSLIIFSTLLFALTRSRKKA